MTMSSTRRMVAAGLTLALLATPALAADERTSARRLPAAWTESLGGGLVAEPADAAGLAQWWQVLDDPLLTRLVERALVGSLDVREAVARVREARARRGAAQAERAPTVSGGASVSASSTAADTSDRYSTGLDASWEIDLFGRRRHAVDAAAAAEQASVEELRDVRVSLASEVALAYLDLRVAQRRLTTAESNLALQEESARIAGWRREAGLTTQLDVDQAQRTVEQTRAQLPPLRTTIEHTKNRVAVLLGQDSGTLDAELQGEGAIPSAPLEVAVGVPADLLRRRPDVRRAEAQVLAQAAQVKSAKAERYPRLSLSGSIGLEAVSATNLISAAARVLTGLINVGQTLFDGGRIRQNIEIQSAAEEQALIAYEAAVLAAVEEVENALVAYVEEQVRLRSLSAARTLAQSAAQLAQERYRSGLADFQAVLEAQRSLLDVEDQLATSTGTVTQNLVRLYKALGGGWTPAAGNQALAPASGK